MQDCAGRLHLFPESCQKCARLLPVNTRHPNPIIPDVRWGPDKAWECVSFKPAQGDPASPRRSV